MTKINKNYAEIIKNNIKKAEILSQTSFYNTDKKNIFISSIDEITKYPYKLDIAKKVGLLDVYDSNLAVLNYVFKSEDLTELLHNADDELLNIFKALLGPIEIYKSISADNISKFNKGTLTEVVVYNPQDYQKRIIQRTLEYGVENELFNDSNEIKRAYNVFDKVYDYYFIRNNSLDISFYATFILSNHLDNLDLNYVSKIIEDEGIVVKLPYIAFLSIETNLTSRSIENYISRGHDFVEREQVLREIKHILESKTFNFNTLLSSLEKYDFTNKELHTILYKLKNEGLPDNSELDSLLKFVYPNFINIGYDLQELELYHFALKNKKKNFLKQLPLLKKNKALSLNRLAKFKSYKVLNLNDISENNIRDSIYPKGVNKLNLFINNGLKNLNLNEFKILSNKQNEHFEIFTKLLYDKDLKRDDKIRLIGELPNLREVASILDIYSDGSFYSKVVNLLKVNSFSSRVEDESHKYNSSSKCKISKEEWLAYFLMDDIDYLKSQASNLNEVDIIISYYKEMKNCGLTDLRQAMEYIFENSHIYTKFKFYFETEQDFLKNNKSALFNFFVSGDMRLFNDYYTSLRCGDTTPIKYLHTYYKSPYHKALIDITKAHILGKLDDIKFFKGDLSKEVAFDIDSKIENIWKKNLSTTLDSYSINEVYDYETVLTLGEKPVKTCNSYIDGEYNYCLLSNFDANKKIITVDLKGNRVARAVLRLTKVSSDSANRLNSSELSFKDVSNLEYLENVDTSDLQEELVLFLEKVYTCDNDLNKVKSIILELASKKAKELNVRLVVAKDYNDCLANSNFDMKKAVSKGYIYISESKNGSQYLDSFEGRANRTAVGYIPIKEHRVLIPNGINVNEKLESIIDIDESAI